MPPASFSRRLEQNILDFVWSVWAELGVAGWERRHSDVLIDPEPLVLFTASVADRDARLRDESTDWCIQFGRLLSKARLKNLLADREPELASNFRAYAATVNRHNRTLRWPAEPAQARTRFEPSGRSKLDLIGRPALMALRLRSVCGVSARAEILRVFLMRPDAQLRVSELSAETRYGKRNVADALDALQRAGLLQRMAVGNSARFSLSAEAALVALFGAPPHGEPRWTDIFSILTELLNVAREAEHDKPLERLVLAERALASSALAVRRAGLPEPPTIHPGKAAWSLFEEWCLTVTRDLAAGSSPAVRGRRPRAAIVVKRRAR